MSARKKLSAPRVSDPDLQAALHQVYEDLQRVMEASAATQSARESIRVDVVDESGNTYLAVTKGGLRRRIKLDD